MSREASCAAWREPGNVTTPCAVMAEIEDELKQAMRRPGLSLSGAVDEGWLHRLIKAVRETNGDDGPMVVEVMTSGGDADMGRRLAMEIELLKPGGRRIVFLGKTIVYSAGVTFMAGFDRADRYLAVGTCLLVHERKMSKTVNLDGPLRACRAQLQGVLSEIEVGFALQQEGFKALAKGSRLSAEQVDERARTDCYISAAEALKLELIEAVFEG